MRDGKILCWSEVLVVISTPEQQNRDKPVTSLFYVATCHFTPGRMSNCSVGDERNTTVELWWEKWRILLPWQREKLWCFNKIFCILGSNLESNKFTSNNLNMVCNCSVMSNYFAKSQVLNFQKFHFKKSDICSAWDVVTSFRSNLPLSLKNHSFSRFLFGF